MNEEEEEELVSERIARIRRKMKKILKENPDASAGDILRRLEMDRPFRQKISGVGNIQVGGDANIRYVPYSVIGSKTPPAGFEYTIRIGHDVKGTHTLDLTEVSDCIMKELKKNGIDAATVKEAGGFWEDRWEVSTEISIIWPSSEDKGDGIKEACRAVCKQLDQDAVLYTKIELSDIEFVERGEG